MGSLGKFLNNEDLFQIRLSSVTQEEEESHIISKLISDNLFPSGDILNLSEYGLNEIPKEIEKLKNLEWIDLSSNNIESIPDWFFSLDKLTFIDLSNNNLKELPLRLFFMKNLLRLDFGYNNLTKFPYWIIENNKLEILNLESCKLRKFPEALRSLKSIKRLILKNNNIRSVPLWLKELHTLKVLNLRGNNLKYFPTLGHIVNLQYINLSNNKISKFKKNSFPINLLQLGLNNNKIEEIPIELTKIEELNRLEIAGNNLTEIPSLIESLKKLQRLDLSNNRISDISTLRNLSNLKQLFIQQNEILSLEPIIGFIEKYGIINATKLSHVQSIKYLNGNLSITQTGLIASENPLISPPIDIYYQGQNQVLRHFERVEKSTEKAILYEAKALIVGRTGAGKTTLRYKLKDVNSLMPNPDESTVGIDIENIHLKTNDEINFIMNVWDFEGQSISYQTHQFFLTKRSIYIFLADNRTEKVDTDYWFQIVELLGGNSPMVIFNNEKRGNTARLNTKALEKRFSFLLSEKTFSADLNLIDKNPTQLQRFNDFTEEIKRVLLTLPTVGLSLEKTWINVRDEIEILSKKESIISEERLWTICEKHGINKEVDQKDLSQLFHDLGILLHFQESDEPSKLSKIVVLRNNWLTKAVYLILKSDYLKYTKKGNFELSDLKKVWSDEPNIKYNFQKYSGELLELMLKFRICFKVSSSKRYIAPQLLNPYPPENYSFPEKDFSIFKYSYRFMPKGIITRLIVELHTLISQKQTLVWQDGFQIEKSKNTIAEISEPPGEREIQIKVFGLNKNIFLNQIIFTIDRINNEFNFTKRLQVNKLIPCTCDECLKNEYPFFHNYEILLKIQDRGSKKVACGETGEQVIINNILQIVSERRQVRSTSDDVLSRLDKKTDTLIENQLNIINHTANGNILSESILNLTKENRDKFDILHSKIDLIDSLELDKINSILEDKLKQLVKELPSTDEIVTKWKEVNSKEMLNLDSKLKAKLKFDLFFIAIEKEFSTDMKPSAKKLLSDLKASKKEISEWINNERSFSQLFFEED